jgi:outer membrane protein assembly factor BamB
MLLTVMVIPAFNGHLFHDNQTIYNHSRPKTSWFINERSGNQFSEKFNENPNAITIANEKTATITGGLMNSSWSMQSHDVKHTGRSQYSTVNNLGAEIWRVPGDSRGSVESSAVIDNNETIYFGTIGGDSSLYALYPNGTRKWKYVADDIIWCTPAIADDGTIYFETWGGYLHALYPNGTKKWSFTPWNLLKSSPAVGDDGTIYFGCDNNNIYAVNTNGTEKWHYATEYFINSAPAIGDDGTIYIGSGDGYLYAVYKNGTLRWRYKTGDWIKGNPSIAQDGTIYTPSFDGYLYAINQNGTMKWRRTTGSSVAGAGVALADDGIIYVGTELLRAYYPNGTLKWSVDVQGYIYGTVPAVSADGTIYVSAGGSLVAVNPDGTERWRKQLTIAQIHSSPCIGSDDRVYVGSESNGVGPIGYLHAFGLGPLRAEAYGPYTGAATEPLQFNGEAFGGTPPYTSYYWNFGDGNTSDEPKPTHIYAHRGNYTATLTVTDIQGNQSQDTAQVTIGYPLPKISLVKPQNAVYFFNIRILPWSYPLVIGRIMFQVEASQIEIGINHVEFYYDGNLMHIDETSPYQWLYTVHAPPLHQTILIRAYDTKGNSNSITKTINKWF